MRSEYRKRKGDHRMIRCKNNRLAAWLRRSVALVLALLMLCGVSVSAADLEGVPYYSYCFWEGASRYEAVPMRDMFETDVRLDGAALGTTALRNPQYVTLSPDYKTLYILDSGDASSGQSRILVVDVETYKLIREIGEIQSSEGPLNYKGAKGLYVAANGDLYIADRENSRVLIADANGQLIRTLTSPTGPDVPSDLADIFKPERVMMDNKGYLYVSSQDIYYGMLVYDTELNFLGFHGSFKVEQSVLATISQWISNLTMTNEKAERSQDKLPAAIIDIAIDTEGFLYTLSSGNSGQIKRMGLNGNQTLNHKFGFTTQSGDLVNFKENPSSYYEIKTRWEASMTSFTVGPDGFIYVLDQNRGRISMYDEECRAICTFGTGFRLNSQVGTFRSPLSIACGEDKLFVMDFDGQSVTVLKRTEYGTLFKEANALTIDGEYDSALTMWEEVLRLDANNQRAYEGMGKAMLSQKNYEEAMKYAKLGNDQQTYSQAYEVVQKAYLSRNFWWIFLLCLAAVGGVAALLVMSKKRKLFEIKNAKLRTALNVPIHPIQAFQSLKYQKNASIGLAAIFVLVFYIATVSEDLYGGFMYVITNTVNYNALYTLLGSVGVLLLWSVVNWAICILSDGKGTLKEVFTMSAYSMTPMIAFSVIFIVASHLIPATSTSTFGILSTIMSIYTVLLLLLGMTVVHEYSFFKAMGMAIVTVVCMLLAAFVIFSVTLLSQQFIVFFVSLFNEIKLR